MHQESKVSRKIKPCQRAAPFRLSAHSSNGRQFFPALLPHTGEVQRTRLEFRFLEFLWNFRFGFWILTFPLVLITFSLPAYATPLSKTTLINLRFEQKLNTQVPLNLAFTDDTGMSLRLGDIIQNRPVILVLGYYECPMLCNLVLNGVVESLQDIRSTVGKDFDVIFVSINPNETCSLAAAKKRSYLKRYGRAESAGGWHFLTGSAAPIQQLAGTVGFQFGYDSAVKQYAHPSGIIVLTPEGRVARYFFGVSYPAAELSAALRAARTRQIGLPVRQLLILCFQHMPLVGKNSEAIMTLVRLLAGITLASLAGYLLWAARRRGSQERCMPES